VKVADARAVPPDTEGWHEAVQHGYIGERTDPFPDTIYNVESGDTLPPLPVITSCMPSNGSAAGNTFVTVWGENFIEVTSVTFGGVEALSIEPVDTGTLNVRTPGGAAGPAPIVVTNPIAPSQPYPFDYNPSPPAPATCIPNVSPIAGGAPVTITGAYFTGVTEVTFGVVPATAVAVVSDTEVTCVTPAQDAAATFEVAVKSPNGTGRLGGFIYE
jgi:hypothetical protein